MTLEEFIQSNPDRNKIAEAICYVANVNVLDIEYTYVWKTLSDLGNFKREDFWDDQEETIKKMGGEAVTHIGIVNWKLK